MTITDAIIIGALLAALFIGMIWVGRKANAAVRELIKTFGDAAASARMAATAAQQVVKELAYMRALTNAQAGATEGRTLEEQQYAAPPAGERPAVVQFPSAIYDRFERVPPPPDAEVDDTSKELLTQTDADLVAMEALEAMRQRGIQVEDSDTEHDGVVAEAE